MDLDNVVQKAKDLLDTGDTRSKQAASRDLVRTYWEAGGLLAAHLGLRDSRAEYGRQLVEQVAAATGRGARQVYDFIDFARKFPTLPRQAPLTWSHYRRLLTVETVPGRHFYVRQAAQEGWTVAALADAIATDRSGATRDAAVMRVDPSEIRLRARRGTPYVYHAIAKPATDRSDRLTLDIGFGIAIGLPYSGPAPRRRQRFTTVQKSDGTYTAAPVETRGEHPYCFKATAVRVVDGDTLAVTVDHGFRITTHQRLRLRGIDTPELWTHAGQAVAAHVTDLMAAVSFVVVQSSRPGKYGRYLADVFYKIGEGEVGTVAREGRFLNRELVERGMAVTA